MAQKRINITLDEDLLKDMDALITAGFYANRTDVIEEGLLLISPLKVLKDKRVAQKIKDITIAASKMSDTPIRNSIKVKKTNEINEKTAKV